MICINLGLLLDYPVVYMLRYHTLRKFIVTPIQAVYQCNGRDETHTTHRGLMEFIQLGEPIVETNKKFFRSFIWLSEILQN